MGFIDTLIKQALEHLWKTMRFPEKLQTEIPEQIITEERENIDES